MSNGDVESIRQRLMSLLMESESLNRKVKRIGRVKNQAQSEIIAAVKQIADDINRSTRELYHLLPEHLRPVEISPWKQEREPRPEGPGGRPFPGIKPGGKIPRHVRWPDWTIEQILALADAFKERHGKWPNSKSGRVSDASPDTWIGIDLALRRGNRGLPGGISLGSLLWEYRRVPTRVGRPPFEIEQILAWADEHHARTQTWPTLNSGPVIKAPHEDWQMIDRALRRGLRGLSEGSSVARLLAERRGVPNIRDLEPLTVAQILGWADAHYRRTGAWPTSKSGDIPEAPDENWKRISHALHQGNRSLLSGSSLARFLAEHRGVRNRLALPHLEVETILEWADRHYERHGRWPTCWTGPIEDAPEDTWMVVDSAFKAGRRGLAESGYRSLADLLDRRRGKLRHRGSRPGERILE